MVYMKLDSQPLPFEILSPMYELLLSDGVMIYFDEKGYIHMSAFSNRTPKCLTGSSLPAALPAQLHISIKSEDETTALLTKM
jgi:hypothetical protein